jgi:hypothetical protein
MGRAWQGDWRGRVYDRIKAHGFSSLIAWSDAQQFASYFDLARAIGPDKDVAPAAIEDLLYEEASKLGAHALHRLMRVGLARYLLHHLPPSGWDERGTPARDAASSAYAGWWSASPKSHREAANRAWDELAARAPRGWRPTAGDDPLLVAAFESVGLGEK